MLYKGEISFDILDNDEVDNACIEGCYRIAPEDWKIFYFSHSHRTNGELWKGEPDIRRDVIWPSGNEGVDVVYPISKPLNKHTAKKLLSDILEKDVDWKEVHGPDSLQLK